jgi:hypothetical protein
VRSSAIVQVGEDVELRRIKPAVVQTIIQPIGDIAMPSTNELIITDNSGTITDIEYVSNSVRKPDGVKSSGSPSVSKSASKSGYVFTIAFECNRKGDEDVADSFKSSSGDALNRYAARGGKRGGPD